jgi:tmRNA-binding protein
MSITLGRGDQKYDKRKEESLAELEKNINLKVNFGNAGFALY